MSDHNEHTLRAADIAATLHGPAFRQIESGTRGNSVSRQLLWASIALAAMQPGIARALTIGELQVRSSLGQPFVATTAARLAPGEVLATGCVETIAHMPGGNASTVALNTAVALMAASGEYPLRITSAASLYEPMYEIQVKVSCPGIPALVKNYVVMLNVDLMNLQAQASALPAPATLTAPASKQAGAKPKPGALATVTGVTANGPPDFDGDYYRGSVNGAGSAEGLNLTASPVATGSTKITGRTYRVRRGDTLLTVAQRIDVRAGLTARQFAGVLLQENPSAFIDGNPDLIKTGFVIAIPDERTLKRSAADNPLPASSAGALSSPGRAEKSAPAAATEQQADAAAVSMTSPDDQSISASAKADLERTPESAAPESAKDTRGGMLADTASAASNPNPRTNDVATSAALAAAAVSPGSPPLNSSAPATEAAATQQTALASVAPPPRPATAPPSKIVATGSGLLVGVFLAALFLGRGFIAAGIPGRLKRGKKAPGLHPDHADTMVNSDGIAADSSPQTAETCAAQTETEAPAGLIDEVPNSVERIPGTTAAAIDLDVDAAEAAIEAALAQAETIESAALANEPETATAEFSNPDMGVRTANDAPRVSLRDRAAPVSALDFDLSDMEEPLEHTRRYSEPSMLADDKPAATAEQAETDGSSTMHSLFGAHDDEPANLDLTSTMRNIFGDAPAFLSDTAETKETPGLSNRFSGNSFASVDIDNTSSLQALSESVISGNADDELSKTLTQALGLLERDYEDELTSSQILEQKDIQKAFAERAAKDT